MLAFIGFTAAPTPSGHADDEIKVTYNNDRILFPSPPITKNGTLYVETRPFIQPLGLQVGWLNHSGFMLRGANLTINMKLNSKIA
jgi:chitinase